VQFGHSEKQTKAAELVAGFSQRLAEAAHPPWSLYFAAGGPPMSEAVPARAHLIRHLRNSEHRIQCVQFGIPGSTNRANELNYPTSRKPSAVDVGCRKENSNWRSL
jgi:hypothetical protein